MFHEVPCTRADRRELCCSHEAPKLLLQNFPQSATDFVFFTDKKMFSVTSSNNRQNGRCTQNAICLHFLYLLNICRKFEFLIYQGEVGNVV